MAENRFRFTKTGLTNLPLPEAGRATYYDEEVKRLALRVTPSGTKTFYVVKRTESSVAWLKLGTFPDMTVEIARTQAQAKLAEFAAGGNPAEAKRQEKKKQTLGQAYEQWKKLYAAPKQIKSTAETQQIWERCLGTLPDEPAKKHGRKREKHPAGVDWSNRKLDQIENTDVRRLHAGIGEKTPVLANRVLEILSTIYNRAREWGYPGENPTEGIKPFKETKRDRFIKHEELPRFFKALEDDTSQDFKHFILLALLTGARRSNVLSMQWQDVDFATQLWRIPDTKNGEPLQVPLVAEAIQILDTRGKKDAGYVFPAESATGHLTPPKKRWQALCKRAKVENLTIHDLRRSLGSWQAITGASLAVIGKSLGHKSPDATMIYARLSVDPVRQSMNTATSAMLTAGGLKTPAPVKSIEGGKRKRKAAA